MRSYHVNTKDLCCGVTPWERKMIELVLSHVNTLTALGGEVRFQKGHAIFYEGHLPYGFYVLKKGSVGLSRVTLTGLREDLTNEGKDVFGLFHLLTNTPHCAMGTAKSDVQMVFVPKAAVLDFLRKQIKNFSL